jgi:HK97 family phage major capsid protein
MVWFVTLPGSGYMVNTSTLGAIRKLKDDNGAYILDPVVEGPSTILGLPVFENPAVASIATGNKAVFFGHWPSVKISTTGLQAAVSSEAFFESDITAFRYVLPHRCRCCERCVTHQVPAPAIV